MSIEWNYIAAYILVVLACISMELFWKGNIGIWIFTIFSIIFMYYTL